MKCPNTDLAVDVSAWCGGTVSDDCNSLFPQLETNKDILVSKSLQALDKFQHQVSPQTTTNSNCCPSLICSVTLYMYFCQSCGVNGDNYGTAIDCNKV